MIYILAAVILVLIYLSLNYRLGYWSRRNVPFISSSVTSAIVSLFHSPSPLFDHYARIYNHFKGCKYGGSYRLFRPQFVVLDPELIKQILVKDFEYFRDRGNVTFDQHDPITNHLFSSPGDLWRALRTRLTPTFTSGKMKFMFGTVKECAEEFQEMLQKPAAKGIALNFKDVSTGYTIEVINSAAFGWKSNAIKNSESEFKKISRGIFLGRRRFQMKLLLNTFLPFLKPYVMVYLLPSKIRNFFFNSVRDTVEYRKRTGYKRNDFLQLLISQNEETAKGSRNPAGHKNDDDLKLTNELMTAQCFLFFVAGFDTSSLILSMTLLELAINTDIQKTVQEEIDYFAAQNENKITYELLKSMPYLHKVIQETLRKYPVLPFISRICTKAYSIPDTNITIEKGTEIIIPITGMHRDAEIYPNPEVFDPERFCNEEIQNRHNYVYIPFGEGPRNCIGSRFGLMTVKLGVVHILQKFNLEKTPKTVYPMKFRPNKLVTDCAYPVLLQCSYRN